MQGWGVKVIFFFKNLFSYFMLSLYTKFQCLTMYGTGQKVCVRWCGVWWLNAPRCRHCSPCYSLALPIGVGSTRVGEQLERLYISGIVKIRWKRIDVATRSLDRYRISKHKGLEETVLCVKPIIVFSWAQAEQYVISFVYGGKTGWFGQILRIW